MVTTINPNAFLLKKSTATTKPTTTGTTNAGTTSNVSPVTTPTTPTSATASKDYTKVVGFGDAGSQVIKGTPLDTGLSATVAPKGTTETTTPIQPKSELPTTTTTPTTTDTSLTDAQKMLTEQQNKETMAGVDVNVAKGVETVEKFNTNKDYLKSQNELQKQITDLGVQNAEIASSQRLLNATTQLDNMKQNIAYLGPKSKSAASLDATRRGLDNANTLYQQLIKTEDNLKTMQKIGNQMSAASFEKQLSDLQDQLDTQVSTTLQGAINSFIQESGKADTVADVQAIREKWLEATDTDISTLTNRQYLKMQETTKMYQDWVNDQKTYLDNKNTVNTELSTAKGYYVDGNGDALVTTSGATIPHIKDAPIDPIFDKETGKMVTFTLGSNGEIVSKIDQVVPQEVFSAETINNIVQSVKNGTLTPDQAISLVPKSGKESLLQQLGSVKLPQTQQYAPKGWSKLDDGSLFNQDTGEIRTASGTTANTTVQTNPQSIIDFSVNKRGRTNLQCGELVNDYLFKITGKDPSGVGRLGNTYDSKITALTNIGLSNGPVEGGLFVSNPLNNNIGHTGIVQSVNADGSITVLEANASGKASGEAPTTRTYTNTSGMTFSQAPQVKTPLTKEEKSTLFSIQDDLKADPRRKEYLTLQSKIKTLDGIKTRLDTGKATAQDKQQLISDFAKVLDPTSVVREGEYALAAKYGQSAINKTIQDISNWYSTNGPISDTSAKVLAEAVGLRFEATQQANNEAVEEQKGRAEIFLGRPVSYDELAVTNNQTTTPAQITKQSTIPSSIANPSAVQGGSVNDPLGLR